MKNKEYTVRKAIIFIVTAIVHVILFQLFMYMKIELKETRPEKEITLVKLTSPPLIYRGDTSPSRPKKNDSSPQSTASQSTETAASDSQTAENSTPPQQPSPKPKSAASNTPAQANTSVTSDGRTSGTGFATPLRAPNTNRLPDLSTHSQDIRDLLSNFDHRKRRAMGFSNGTGANGSGGGTGGTGQVVFNVRNYDITPWAKRVLLSVHKHWEIPLITKTKADQPLEVIVIISRKGKITSLNIKQTSNADAFDNSAISALRQSQPFPYLPDDFPALNLEARFIFTRHNIDL